MKTYKFLRPLNHQDDADLNNIISINNSDAEVEEFDFDFDYDPNEMYYALANEK